MRRTPWRCTLTLALALPLLAAHGRAAALPADSTATAPRPRWALVLSGGAARGFAFAGAVRALEEEGLRPDLIVGTSAGGLVGALYASGYSSRDMRRMLTRIDWEGIFATYQGEYEWRRTVLPRPWVTFTSEGRGVHYASALVDAAAMNYALSVSYLRGEGLALGDFDRLPIPLRVVGSEIPSLRSVTIGGGSLARAIRITSSVTPVFPPLPEGRSLLMDGGLASNLPVSVARDRGLDHILAVDVAIPYKDLDEHSSAFDVAFQLFDLLNKRGQVDTLSSRDRLIWLRLPGVSPTYFAGYDTAIARGYRECRARVREIADSLGLPRDHTLVPPAPVVLPPLASLVEFRDRFGNRARRAPTAQARLGRLPRGPFEPEALAPAIQRVYRTNLFRSAWPSLRVEGDSTRLSFEVAERSPREIGLALGYDTDRLARAGVNAVFRPLRHPWPPFILLGGSAGRYGWQAHGAIGPHGLVHGGSGWFLRGGARRTDTRLFDGKRNLRLLRTDRVEAVLGLQQRLPWGDVVQTGGGGGSALTAGLRQEGLLAAFRLQGHGPLVHGAEGVVMGGPDGYAVGSFELGLRLGIAGWQLQPTFVTAYASEDAPADEIEGLGGPRTFAGLRQNEWLGHRLGAVDVRISRRRGVGTICAYAQAGRVQDVVSRPDFEGRLHFAVGLGAQLDVPFGPIRLDWGLNDRGDDRLEFGLGQSF